MPYAIQFTNSALKQLYKLSKDISYKIARDINELGYHPRPIGYKKLKGEDDLYRIRCGNYRIIYQICDKVLIVLVIRIGDRKEVYRNL